MAEVFVSYSQEDRESARAIVDAIEQAGLSVIPWPAKGAGELSAQQIREQIESAPCVVCLWSESAARSSSMQQDVQHAIRAWSEGRLLVATLDAAALPVGLRDLQGIPLRRGTTGIDATELLAAVKTLIGQRSDQPLAAIPDALPVKSHPAPALPASVGRRCRIAAPLIASAVTLVGVGLVATWMNTDPEPSAQKTRTAPQFRSYKKTGAGGGADGGAPNASAEIQPAPNPPTPTPAAPPRAAPVPSASSSEAAASSSAAEAQPIQRPAPPPPPSASQPAPADGWLLVLIMLMSGIAIGAGSVWLWSLLSRRRQSREAVTAGRTPVVAAPVAANAMHQVFVSYSRQDGQAVDKLVSHIEQAGYTVWIDRHSTGSQRYAAPIVRAIKTSQIVALMCSENAFTSDHVIREIYVAGDYKKPFIAFQLDPSDFPDDVQYFVSGFPRVPIGSLDIQQLRFEIARLVAERPN